MEIGVPEYLKLKTSAYSFLRKRGGENTDSFFAICVETFFETPHYFHNELPDIYHHLCVVLRQNPLHIALNYTLTEDWYLEVNRNRNNIKIPKQFRKNTFKFNWQWHQTILFGGVAVMLPIYAILSKTTDIIFSEIMYLYALSTASAFVALHKKIVREKWMNTSFFTAFALVGYSNFLTGCVLILNYLVSYDVLSEEHYITNVVHFPDKSKIIVRFEKEQDYWGTGMDEFGFDQKEFIAIGDYLKFDVHSGIMGFEVYKNKRVIKDLKN